MNTAFGVEHLKCGICDGEQFTPGTNPFVECRTRRPTIPTEMTCVMAGHLLCISPPGLSLPAVGQDNGIATPEQWQTWIEGPDAEAKGFQLLG